MISTVPSRKLRHLMPARRTMNCQTVVRLQLPMRGSGAQKSCSSLTLQEWSLRVYTSNATIQWWSAMWMSERTSSSTLSWVEDQLSLREWEKECGRKSISSPHQLTKSKFLLHQRENTQFGLEDLSLLPCQLSKPCGLINKSTTNQDQQLFTESASENLATII